MTDARQPLDPRDQAPATNCLDGIRCPVCGSTRRFQILATVDVTMVDNGTEEAEGSEWDATSPITCASCQHTGTVGQFRAPEQVVCRECGNDVFVTVEGTAHHWRNLDEPYADHGSDIDHDLDADHVAVPDVDDVEAYLHPEAAPMTTQVSPAQLVGGETIVGDAGGYLVVSGEVYASNAMPGMYAVENEFGTLYLDADLPVQILVED